MQRIEQCVSDKMRNAAFLCACLVVFRHAPIYGDSFAVKMTCAYVSLGICDIAVPYFFYAAGFFLEGSYLSGEGWLRSLRKRVRSLIVPYLIFCTIAYVLKGPLTLKLLQPETLLDGFGFNMHYNPAYQLLWFVRSLLIFTLAAPVAVVTIEKLGKWSWVILAVLFGWWFSLQEAFLGPKWLFFYILGMLMRARAPEFHLLDKRLGVMLLAVGVGLLWCEYTLQLPMHLPALVCLVPGFYFCVPEAKWPTWLTSTSFAIYLFHGIGFYGLRKLCPFSGVCWYFLSGVAMTVLCCAAAVAMKKCMPRIYSVCTGGR